MFIYICAKFLSIHLGYGVLVGIVHLVTLILGQPKMALSHLFWDRGSDAAVKFEHSPTIRNNSNPLTNYTVFRRKIDFLAIF